MTLKEALLNDNEKIDMAVASFTAGETDQEYFDNNFGTFTGKEVPLSDADFQALLDSTQSIGWKLNFHALRYQGRI